MNDNRQSVSRNVEFAMFAITATVFAAIALVSLIVFGEPDTRNAAIVGALFASASQFVGSNTFGLRKAFIASIVLAYAAFASLIIAVLLLIF